MKTLKQKNKWYEIWKVWKSWRDVGFTFLGFMMGILSLEFILIALKVWGVI